MTLCRTSAEVQPVVVDGAISFTLQVPDSYPNIVSVSLITTGGGLGDTSLVNLQNWIPGTDESGPTITFNAFVFNPFTGVAFLVEIVSTDDTMVNAGGLGNYSGTVVDNNA